MSKAKSELFIWWTTVQEAMQLGPEAPKKLPEYVRALWLDRYMSQGPSHQRLFIQERFGARAITEWPDTGIARGIKEGTSQGIVLSGSDLRLFTDDVPGIVTDFKFCVIVVR